MTSLTERYGPTALIAGASEGLGAAWAHALAAQGFNLILIARRPEPLTEITRELTQKFGIEVLPLAIDLSAQNAKAFGKVLAESLWYEWRPCNVDVIACCAGATATPNYIATNPGKASSLEPEPQLPAAAVAECLRRIGTTPSFVSGSANKWITFFMQHILSKKAAIRMMSDGLKKMYRIVPLVL